MSGEETEELIMNKFLSNFETGVTDDGKVCNLLLTKRGTLSAKLLCSYSKGVKSNSVHFLYFTYHALQSSF